MTQEIERKFLVVGDEWRRDSRRPRPIRQGYVVRGPDVVVRVRVFGAHAYLTIKSTDPGLVRTEFEYEIPVDHAESLLARACCGQFIEKTRHKSEWSGIDWVIDEFHGALTGLILPKSNFIAQIKKSTSHLGPARKSPTIQNTEMSSCRSGPGNQGGERLTKPRQKTRAGAAHCYTLAFTQRASFYSR